ncbi:MAG: hypothetical protein ISQ84_05780 [Pelagibacterales bacterium]|nr:hypothetical protein [Pelagibacterales bacterium]
MSKNNVDKRLDPNPKQSKDNISKEIKLAKKDVMELDIDALNDVLDTLKTIHQKEDPDTPFDTWFDSKDDDFFKRLKYGGGGKVIKFPTDYTKWREPNYKEINISAGFDKDKTVASLTDAERKVVNRLLRLSLGKDK